MPKKVPKYTLAVWLVILALSGRNVFTSFVTQYDFARQDTQVEKAINCLSHEARNISDSWKVSGGVMRQNRSVCGTLRHDWSIMNTHFASEWASQIHEHQSNCKLPVATHFLDNTYGLGSHLILWGQAVCNAMEENYRIHSVVNESDWWIWMDQEYCSEHKENPLDCYFPFAEQPKTCDAKNVSATPTVKDPRAHRCFQIQQNMTTKERDDYRTGVTEYLFRHISPLVIQEAKRQVGVIFPGGKTPENLIAIHIRWGDKFWEMDLVHIYEYIDAVNALVNSTPSLDTNEVHVYLATEDPKAYEQFMKEKPSNWKVYADITLQEMNAFRPLKGNRASHVTRNTKGRAGLVALGSLLVTMEAKYFVLTTRSNWSALINHLRKTILDQACNDCTKAIDLRPFVW